jgi:hypothetical protein
MVSALHLPHVHPPPPLPLTPPISPFPTPPHPHPPRYDDFEPSTGRSKAKRLVLLARNNRYRRGSSTEALEAALGVEGKGACLSGGTKPAGPCWMAYGT